jgi:hypothetical protein
MPSLFYYDIKIIFCASQTIFVRVRIAMVGGLLHLTTWLQELCGGDVNTNVGTVYGFHGYQTVTSRDGEFFSVCHISNNDKRL